LRSPHRLRGDAAGTARQARCIHVATTAQQEAA